MTYGNFCVCDGKLLMSTQSHLNTEVYWERGTKAERLTRVETEITNIRKWGHLEGMMMMKKECQRGEEVRNKVVVTLLQTIKA